MSENFEENEGKNTIKVTDRRRFTSEGEVREGVGEEEEKNTTKSGTSNQSSSTDTQATSQATQDTKPSHEKEVKEDSATEKTPSEKRENTAEHKKGQRPTGMDKDFSALLISLASSAQSALGLSPNPMTGVVEPNLEQAKNTIALIEMLKQKTQGNLSIEEEQILQAILYELQMAYVQARQHHSGAAPKTQ